MTIPDAVPPHDIEIERAVLGSIMADAPIPKSLKATHFYSEQHRTIYRAILSVKNPDELTIIKYLRDREEIEGVGGVTYISSLTSALPDIANVDHYAEQILEDAHKRKAAQLGARLQNGEDAKKILAELQVLESGSGPENKAVFRTLQEYLDDPSLMQPPEAVIENLAWKGRVTLLAAREKAGKSTYAALQAAVLSQAWEDSNVLWIGPEESPYDIVQRFTDLGANPDNITICEFMPNGMEDIRAFIVAIGGQSDLVVIDTLGSWCSGRVQSMSDAAQMTPVMLEFVKLARDFRAAVVLIHHGRKEDGGYRDSSAIGAMVDVIMEMYEDGKDENLRHFKPKGRIPVKKFSLRWNGESYDEPKGERADAEIIYDFIAKTPGCGTRYITKNITGMSMGRKIAAIQQLETQGRIVIRVVGNKKEHRCRIDDLAAFDGQKTFSKAPRTAVSE